MLGLLNSGLRVQHGSLVQKSAIDSWQQRKRGLYPCMMSTADGGFFSDGDIWQQGRTHAGRPLSDVLSSRGRSPRQLTRSLCTLE